MNTPPSTRKVLLSILLADDSDSFRRLLREFLQKSTDVELVGEATDGEEAVRQARELRPDIVIMDVMMPWLNGIEATRQITTELTSIKVIAISMHGDRGFRRAMLDAGASTYMLKEDLLRELPEAFRSIAADRA